MLTLVLAFGVGSAALGQVSPRVPELEQAADMVDNGDFEDAVRTLEKGLGTADLTDDQLVEMYKLLGLSHLYLGNEEKARQAFEKLLQARPDYEVPKSAPPKVRSLYGRIKDDIKKRRVRPVTVNLEPVGVVKGGDAVVVNARIDDLALGAKAKLFFRRAGAQSYSSADFTRKRGAKDDFAVMVPAFNVPEEEQAYDIEYYVEIADAAQRRLAGRGDAFNPLTFKVSAKGLEAGGPGVEAERPWYKIPWVWVGVGVGVAAITTTAVVLATRREQAAVTVNITVQGP